MSEVVPNGVKGAPAHVDKNRGRHDFAYPRRRVMRFVLRGLSRFLFSVLAKVEVRGLENIPDHGPVILAANHFHFSDPAALIWLPARQIEFVGGFRFPNAPMIVKFIPRLWGYFPVHRGAYSRASLEYAIATLENRGVVGIFPEGWAKANVLRPARPGLGFVAVASGAPVVPVALEGFPKLFREWRPQLKITIGAPIHFDDVDIGNSNGDEGSRKELYDRFGQKVMAEIADLLPEDQRGVFADAASVRETAEAIAYPFDQKSMRGM